MSLIKAFNFKNLQRHHESIADEFLTVVGDMCESEMIEQDDIASLISLYAEYSCNYLNRVAVTLFDDTEMAQTMKFMNSFIVEFMHNAGLHYYNRAMEGGMSYTIIDIVVQEALNNEGIVEPSKINQFIADIEASYKEDDEEDVSLN